MTALGAEAAQVLVAARDENFPVALRILPAELRDGLRRAYAYARLVDDVGDGRAVADPAERAALLDTLDVAVDALEAGARTTGVPVVDDLRVLLDRGVGARHFRSLLAAQRLEATTAAYADLAALRAGCALSADPVGRIVLELTGVHDERADRLSDDVCSALQLLEHCQDVGEDARGGHVYVPQDRLTRVAPAELTGRTTSPGVRAAVLSLVADARRLLDSARPLVAGLRGAGRVAVAGFAAGGLATADALEQADGAVLETLVSPSRRSVARHAATLLVTARGGPSWS